MEQVRHESTSAEPDLAGFPRRLVFLVLLLILEKLLLVHAQPFLAAGTVRSLSGAPALFALALLFFGKSRFLSAGLDRAPISRGFAIVHLSTLAVLTGFHLLLNRAIADPSLVAHRNLAGVLWTTLSALATLSLVAALIPFNRWRRLAVHLGPAWLYAAVCTGGLLALRPLGIRLWDAPSSRASHLLQDACLGQTAALLRLVCPRVLVAPQHHLLGTPRFLVEISWLCSGIEGLATVAILLTLWLFFTRRQLRLLRAALVLPLALSVTWVLNLVRIAALIVIGDAGHPQVANNGFHAQAGWISLNLLVLGSLLLVGRVRWFQQDTATSVSSGSLVDYPGQVATSSQSPVPYLLPLAALLGASLISQAASGGFEWLYALRFAAVLLALWLVRKSLHRIDWRFGPLGISAGVAVAAVWLASHTFLPHAPDNAAETAAALARLATPERLAWITIRVLAAIITVPLAEELAFRGFLARRLVSADFADVPYRRLTPLALIVSSAAFGAVHGHLWPAGVVAGLLFGLVAMRANRLGEALAAHASSNLVLAVVALARNDFTLW